MAERTRQERLHELLGALGDSRISVEEYRRRMAESGLTEDDVDLYLAQLDHTKKA
jgi:hypothetical protein